MNKFVTVSFLKNFAKLKRGKCLSLEEISMTKPLLWQCNNYHIFKKDIEQLLQNNDDEWCLQCKRNKEKSISPQDHHFPL
jgi:hypothetical protein